MEEDYFTLVKLYAQNNNNTMAEKRRSFGL